ncbi:MAG: putative Small-conductance mechanosensitive ion channel [Deltaproteobacteria bacterium]|nr:putative Small-conductance mechanosensitive ion channel [Deltaproteobacteria bacterium]
MSAHTWESFIAYLLTLGVDAAQALIRIGLIVTAGYVIIKLLRAGFGRLENFLIHATEKTKRAPGAAGQRIKTLASVLWTIANGFLWFIIVLIVLSQFGVNVGPILAGAGVFGLAAGFGAQHLVRDLVSGFFLLLENQIRVGDMAIINGTAGLVEAVTFRTIVLRHHQYARQRHHGLVRLRHRRNRVLQRGYRPSDWDHAAGCRRNEKRNRLSPAHARTD